MMHIITLAVLVFLSMHRAWGSRVTGPEKFASRIVSGRDADEYRFPYTVSLQRKGFHVCTGSMIAPDIVLSAAHCERPIEDLVVRVNPYNINNPISVSQLFRVEEGIIHPRYEELRFSENDVWLLRLDIHNNTSSLPFVTLNSNPKVPVDNQQVQTMGWGRRQGDDVEVSAILQQTMGDVMYINNHECVDQVPSFANFLTDGSLCVLGDSNTCLGDSGGPTIIPGNDPDSDIQIGISSVGPNGCSISLPRVRARVSTFYTWIQYHVCRLSVDPPESFQCKEIDVATPARSSKEPSTSPSPTAETVTLTVRLNFDRHPEELGWFIEDADGHTRYSYPPGSFGDSVEPNGSVNIPIQLEPSQPFVIQLVDSGHDGFCCTSGTGSFFIFLGAGEDYDKILYYTNEFNDTMKADLFFAGDQHLIPFDGTPTRAPSRSLSPSSGPSVSPAPSSLGTASLTVVVEPGTFPERLAWAVFQNDFLFLRGIGTYGPFTGTIVETISGLHPGQRYGFLIAADGDRGLTPGSGSAKVYFGSETTESNLLAYDDGNFRAFFRRSFFVLSEDSTFKISPSPSSAPTIETMYPTTPPTPYPAFTQTSPTSLAPRTSTILSIQPTPSPIFAISMSPSALEAETPFPTATPTLSTMTSISSAPSILTTEITIAVKLHSFPEQIIWDIEFSESGEVAAEGGPYGNEDADIIIYSTISLPQNQDFVFTIAGFTHDGITEGYAIVYLSDREGVSDDLVLLVIDGMFSDSTQLGMFSTTEAAIIPWMSPPSVVPSLVPTQSWSLFPSSSITPSTSLVPSVEQVDISLRFGFDSWPDKIEWKIYAYPEMIPLFDSPRFTYSPYQAGPTVDEIVRVQLGRSYLLYVTDAADGGACCLAGSGDGVSVFLGPEAGISDNMIAFLPIVFGSDEIRVFTAGVEGILASGTFPTVSPTETAGPTSTTITVLMEIILDADPSNLAWIVFEETPRAYNQIYALGPAVYKVANSTESIPMTLKLGHSYLFYTYNDGGNPEFDIDVVIYFGSAPDSNSVLYQHQKEPKRPSNEQGGFFTVSEAGIQVNPTVPPTSAPATSFVMSVPAPSPEPSGSTSPSEEPSFFPTPLQQESAASP